jgi:hypothetical protein
LQGPQLMRVLWPEVHRSIEDSARSLVDSVGPASRGVVELAYPPGANLTAAEAAALRALALDEVARTALGKLAASVCGMPIFDLLALFDGAADPAATEGEFWPGVELIAGGEEDRPMLHDEFFESYEDYARERDDE